MKTHDMTQKANKRMKKLIDMIKGKQIVEQKSS